MTCIVLLLLSPLEAQEEHRRWNGRDHSDLACTVSDDFGYKHCAFALLQETLHEQTLRSAWAHFRM